MKLCISTTMDVRYQHFCPMFLRSLELNYPEYHVKIFSHGSIDDDVKSFFSYQKHELVEGVFNGWTHKKWEPISWRFLVPPKHYREFDFVYVGDLDLVIMKEKVTLLNFHLNELGETGLTYSNSLRTAKHWRGHQSLTGLHFASAEWFKQTEGARQKHAEAIRKGKEGDIREWDGHMLYLMCKESGLKTPKKYPLVERHHGIHIGTFKLMSKDSKLRKRMGIDKLRIWKAMRSDTKFNQAVEIALRNPLAAVQVEALDRFCRKRLK